jgi:hypothetical protein
MRLLVHNAGLDTGTREPSFAVGLQGLSPSDVPKVERLIMDTIEKVCVRFVSSSARDCFLCLSAATCRLPFFLHLLRADEAQICALFDISQDLVFLFVVLHYFTPSMRACLTDNGDWV